MDACSLRRCRFSSLLQPVPPSPAATAADRLLPSAPWNPALPSRRLGGGGMICKIHVGKHLRTRAGAAVFELESGLVRVIEACGGEGEAPDLLWNVLKLPHQAAPATPPCPYQSAADPPNPNNPPLPGTLPPDNITRHWEGGSFTYHVNTPSTNLMHLGGGIYYTYAMFSADVQATFATLAAIPCVDITPTFAGTTTTNYEVSGGGPVFPTMAGTFVWSTTGTPPGPTGDGMNEFIFLKSTSIAPTNGGGLTSMDVDPTSGTIIECDVIYTLQVPAVWGGGGPAFSTGIPHEIGHFLGLDHTNLHPGGTGSQPAPYEPQPIAGYPPSIGMSYPAGFLAHRLPMMVGRYVVTGVNYIAYLGTAPPPPVPAPPVAPFPWPNQVHPDDIAGLARIYPVLAIDQPVAGKQPIGNLTGTIIGTFRNSSNTAGQPWFNVYVLPHSLAATSVTPAAPANGAPSGTARTGSTSVLGMTDTVTQIPGTGEFRIVGIRCDWTDPNNAKPLQFDVVGEPLECIGITPPHFGEYVVDPVINPTANAWPPPSTIPGLTQGAMISNDQGQPAAVSLGSLSMVPGTVITLTGPFIAGNGQVPEAVSRPLVEIVDRTLPIPQAGISVNVYHNYGVTLRVSCAVDGKKFTPVLVSAHDSIPRLQLLLDEISDPLRRGRRSPPHLQRHRVARTAEPPPVRHGDERDPVLTGPWRIHAMMHRCPIGKPGRRSAAILAVTLLAATASAQFQWPQWPLHTIVGNAVGELAGWHVCLTRDMNGDGKGEVAAASPGDDTAFTNAGAVRVYAGGTWTLLHTFFGASSLDYFGMALASGDVNLDGRADLIVGVPDADPGGVTMAGVVYVYSGLDGSLLHQFDGNVPNGQLGFALASDDVDGDGHDDVIANQCATYPPAGAVHAYSGATGALIRTIGGEYGSAFGIALAADDFDLDGYADVAVGSPVWGGTPGFGRTDPRVLGPHGGDPPRLDRHVAGSTWNKGSPRRRHERGRLPRSPRVHRDVVDSGRLRLLRSHRPDPPCHPKPRNHGGLSDRALGYVVERRRRRGRRWFRRHHHRLGRRCHPGSLLPRHGDRRLGTHGAPSLRLPGDDRQRCLREIRERRHRRIRLLRSRDRDRCPGGVSPERHRLRHDLRPGWPPGRLEPAGRHRLRARSRATGPRHPLALPRPEPSHHRQRRFAIDERHPLREQPPLRHHAAPRDLLPRPRPRHRHPLPRLHHLLLGFLVHDLRPASRPHLGRHASRPPGRPLPLPLPPRRRPHQRRPHPARVVIMKSDRAPGAVPGSAGALTSWSALATRAWSRNRHAGAPEDRGGDPRLRPARLVSTSCSGRLPADAAPLSIPPPVRTCNSRATFGRAEVVY